MNNIGVFGIGCIGSVLAKYLILNKDNTFLFYNRSKKSTVTILFNGNKVSLPINLKLSTQVIDLDWLIVCIKEYHYVDAIQDLQSLIGKQTKVAIFRNGLNLDSPFNAFVPSENILETIIDCSIQLNEMGEYLQLKKPTITVPKSTLGIDFINLFGNSEIEFIQSNSFRNRQWEKLIESSAIGSIQTYTNRTCEIFQEKKYKKLYREIVQEGIQVANSIGLELDENFESKLMDKLQNYPGHKASSMLNDFLAKNRIELDAKLGVIYFLGLKNNVVIPKTIMLYKALIEI